MQNYPSSTEAAAGRPATVRPIAFRVRILEHVGARDSDDLVVPEPRSVRFAFEEIGIEEALAVQDGAGRPTDAAILTILIFLPTGAQTSIDIQKQVDAARKADRKFVLMLIQREGGVQYIPLSLSKGPAGKDKQPG